MKATANETVLHALSDCSDPTKGITFTQTDHFLSYPDLRDEARKFAYFLISQLNLKKRDRIVVILPDEQEFVIAFTGSLWAGIVPVPLYPPLLIAQMDSYKARVAAIYDQCGATLLLTSTLGRDLLQHDEIPIRVELFPEVVPTQAFDGDPDCDKNDLAFIQFTSGSTNSPKGVAVSHRSLVENARAIIGHLRITGEDRGVSWLPLYHDMGLIGFLMVPIMTDGLVWLMSPLQFARRPTDWCDTISKVGGTISYAPSFAYGLLTRRITEDQIDSWDLSSWRVAGSGAEPVSGSDLRTFAELLRPTGFRSRALLPSYGLAEMTLAVTISELDAEFHEIAIDRVEFEETGWANPAKHSRASISLISCGPPMSGFRIQIVDPASRLQVKDGRQGLVLTGGPSIADGYFRDPDRTNRIFDDGWVDTGDLGLIHEGELFITGREKDQIILNGRNYHPQDIEAIASAVPGARRGCSVAFSISNQGKETAVVVIESRGDSGALELSRAAMRDVHDRLGVTLADVIVIGSNSIPRTSSGKVRRSESKRMYLEGMFESRLQ